jgi:hypothetical protein
MYERPGLTKKAHEWVRNSLFGLTCQILAEWGTKPSGWLELSVSADNMPVACALK